MSKVWSFGNCHPKDGYMDHVSFSEHATKLHEEMRTLLTQCGLVSMYLYEQQMETDSQFSIQTVDLEIKNKQITLPVEYVQLWPLFEYISTLQSWAIINAQNKSGINKSDVELFSEFSEFFTPSDGSESILYYSLKEGDIKVGHSFRYTCPDKEHLQIRIQPFPKQQILDASKLIDLTDDSLEFDRKHCVKRRNYSF